MSCYFSSSVVVSFISFFLFLFRKKKKKWFCIIVLVIADKLLKMATALLYSPPSHLSFSSPKPHIFSFNTSSPSSISPSHFSRHFNTAQTLRFPSKTRSITPVAEGIISRELSEIYQSCNLWNCRGFNISYLVKGNGSGPPLLLVHGFGASIAHWRR